MKNITKRLKRAYSLELRRFARFLLMYDARFYYWIMYWIKRKGFFENLRKTKVIRTGEVSKKSYDDSSEVDIEHLFENFSVFANGSWYSLNLYSNLEIQPKNFTCITVITTVPFCKPSRILDAT